jgi:dTDP-glucose 4,6-dehydratase
MEVLVTGAAGFIGSEFVRHILEARPAWRLVLLDALSYAGRFENLSGLDGGLETIAVEGHIPEGALEKAGGTVVRSRLGDLPAKLGDRRSGPGGTLPPLLVLGDITDASLVESLVSQADAVVHLAAETHVDRSLADPGPFVRANVQGTCTLLEAARRSPKLRRFLHVSTDEVYGDATGKGVLDEDSPLAPTNPYSVTKAAAEQMVFAYARAWNVPALVVRPTNNFGPRQFPEKFIPTVVTRALAGEQVPLYGDGRQVRDWLHVSDTAQALRLVLEKGSVGRAYNVAGRNPMENRDVALAVLRALGLGEERIGHVPDRPGHDRAYAIDDSRIRAELGFENSRTFELQLAETIRWYRENRSWGNPA